MGRTAENSLGQGYGLVATNLLHVSHGGLLSADYTQQRASVDQPRSEIPWGRNEPTIITGAVLIAVLVFAKLLNRGSGNR